MLFLCRRRDLGRERYGYTRAFQKRGIDLACVDDHFPLSGDMRDLLDKCPKRPMLIIQPETTFPLLPQGLVRVDIPTSCFQIDTHAYTHRRIRWSMLFDYALLFHPGFEEHFRRAGHPRPITVAHAVDGEVFSDIGGGDRPIEVGWVGRTDGPLYETRRRILGILSYHFQMNDWHRRYSYEEMAEVYKRSKVVVNVGRDDYPQDANLRAFEVMAAGALLVTRLPTELSLMGFEEGVHFVGYSDEGNLVDIVSYYLAHESERRRIAEVSREKVLREHTYDCRVEQLLGILQEDKGKLFAPARYWPEDKVRLVYLDYYAAHGLLDLAWRELQKIVRENPRTASYALRPILGALVRKWRWR